MLIWQDTQFGPEAQIGDFEAGDGVRFSVSHMPTCYRRGPWRLLIEVAGSPRKWGCFDDQDQPMRWYHSLERLKAEAQAIAEVLEVDVERKLKAGIDIS